MGPGQALEVVHGERPIVEPDGENRGLSARNVPWAAMCASHAPSRALSTCSAVALPRPSITDSGY